MGCAVTRTVQEWTVHWNSRAVIDDPIEASGYCVDGVPVDAETYRAAVIEPWLDRLQLEPQHHVLDVGCGCGLLLEQLASRVQRAVGTDIGDVLLGTAPPTSPYPWYDPSELTTLLRSLPVRFAIEPQAEPKRAINVRHDVLVFKDR